MAQIFNVQTHEFQKMADEPLCEELKRTVTIQNGIQMVAHKFCHTWLAMPGIHNRTFAHNRDRAAQAARKGDWQTFVFAHERPYRCDALMEARKRMSPKRRESRYFGELAAQVWQDSENINQCWGTWKYLFNYTQGWYWMSADDQKVFVHLPDKRPFRIFRGVCDDGGVSWSLSYSTAVFFANRGINGSTGEVIRADVNKSEVYAYLGGRGEKEIIVHPRSLAAVMSRAVKIERTAEGQEEE